MDVIGKEDHGAETTAPISYGFAVLLGSAAQYVEAVIAADYFGGAKKSYDLVGFPKVQLSRRFELHADSLAGPVGQWLSNVLNCDL